MHGTNRLFYVLLVNLVALFLNANWLDMGTLKSKSILQSMIARTTERKKNNVRIH